MPSGPFYGEGLHTAEILQQGLTQAQTGTTQFMLLVKILGVPDASGNYEPLRQQYERRVYMPLTDKTMEYQVANLELLGFTGTTLQQLDPSHPEHQSFVGNQVDLWCKHESYNGKVGERWQLSNRQQVEMKPVDGKAMKQLDSLFGKAKRAAGKSTPTPINAMANKYAGRSTADDYANEQITDDDIPF